MDKLCVVKIRSTIRCGPQVRRGMETLKLNKLYSCSIIDKTEQNMGVLKVIDSWVTYGEINKDMMKKLLKRRSRVSNRKALEWKDDDLQTFVDQLYEGKSTIKSAKIKETFHLHPPLKGFEKRGKKTPFGIKGAFGYRGEDINKLLVSNQAWSLALIFL